MLFVKTSNLGETGFFSKPSSTPLRFSTVADLMGLVSLKIKPSIHAAYKRRSEGISVSITSIYNKLALQEFLWLPVRGIIVDT